MKSEKLFVFGNQTLAEILKEVKLFKNYEIINKTYDSKKTDLLQDKDLKENLILLDLSNILITKNLIRSFGKNSIFLINKKNFNSDLIKDYEKCLLPFKLNDLLSKIKILSLKKDYKNRSIFQVLDYQLDINKKVIIKNDLKLKLTEKEVTLLVYLIELGRPAKISELLKVVWDYSSESETHTIETHVHRLRKKFIKIFNDENIIKNNTEGYFI
tara:strand:+ start:166 stop:807 length:642 start_codon:yes stop_codon:yes gene_type:complete